MNVQQLILDALHQYGDTTMASLRKRMPQGLGKSAFLEALDELHSTNKIKRIGQHYRATVLTHEPVCKLAPIKRLLEDAGQLLREPLDFDNRIDQAAIRNARSQIGEASKLVFELTKKLYILETLARDSDDVKTKKDCHALLANIAGLAQESIDLLDPSQYSGSVAPKRNLAAEYMAEHTPPSPCICDQGFGLNLSCPVHGRST